MNAAPALPAALAGLAAERRWLVWRWEVNDKGRPTKVPYRGASPDRKASSTDARTWCKLETAEATVAAGRADGIGFALYESKFAAFDIDDCRDRETHEVTPWAMRLVERAGSYAEITVSGTGLRIIGVAEGGYVHRNQPVPDEVEGRIETYRSASRYIVVTGQSLDNPPTALANIDPLIDETVAWLDEAKRQKVDGERAEKQRQRESERHNRDRAFRPLPFELVQLIRDGVPEGQRSEQFHHVVGWLKQLGWTASAIVAELERYPQGIAEKYLTRLAAEVDRSFGRTEEPRAASVEGAQDAPGSARGEGPAQVIRITWHRDADPNAERAWLVANLIAQTGKGLLSGQWGSCKTFIAIDLAGCIMSGEAFAGRRVLRRGGVLFLAAEGASEIPTRLRGLVNAKLSGAAMALAASGEPPLDPDDLPFGWIEELPRLVSPEAVATLIATADAAARELRDRYGLPLALIVLDTVAAGAGFDDENSAAETQKVMNALERLSAHTGAFVLGVDHFGKAVETGTRGSSAKEAAADTVLAALASRDEAGNVSNTRMAVRKVRGAPAGQETPYSLDVVEIGRSRWGEPITTCVINWQETRAADLAAAVKDRWTQGLRVFGQALGTALSEHGIRAWPHGATGHEHLAAPLDRVRAAFYAIYPAAGETDGQRSEAKRKQFARMVQQAQGRGLIGSIELSGVDHLWRMPDIEQPSA